MPDGWMALDVLRQVLGASGLGTIDAWPRAGPIGDDPPDGAVIHMGEHWVAALRNEAGAWFLLDSLETHVPITVLTTVYAHQLFHTKQWHDFWMTPRTGADDLDDSQMRDTALNPPGL